ncbi:MAG: hypothetical protein Kow0010_25200 [Dehalococcoidia bacterium]
MSERTSPEPRTTLPPSGHGTYVLDVPYADNPYVMSAAAHGALAGEPAMVLALEGVYQLSHAEFVGNVSVMPGTMRGSNRVGVYLRRSAEREGGIRLFANVRTSWLHGACRGARDDGERAVLLAAALCELGAIPGQHTVAVLTDHASPADELLGFARLLRAAAASRVEPAA